MSYMTKAEIVNALKSKGFIATEMPNGIIFTNTRNGQSYRLTVKNDCVWTYGHNEFSVFIGRIRSIFQKVSCLMTIDGTDNIVYVPYAKEVK